MVALGAALALADGILPNIPPPNAPGIYATAGVSVLGNYLLNNGNGFPYCGYSTCSTETSSSVASIDDETAGGTHAAQSAVSEFSVGTDGILTELPSEPSSIPGIVGGSATASGSEGHADGTGMVLADHSSAALVGAGTQWWDTVTLTSGTLPSGSLVTLVATLTIDAQISGRGGGYGEAAADVSGGGDDPYGFTLHAENYADSNGNHSVQTDSEQFTAYVGEQIPLTGDFGIGMQANASQTSCSFGGSSGLCTDFSVNQDASGADTICWDCGPPTIVAECGDSNPCYMTPDAQWVVTADHFAHFTLAALDPTLDLTLTTASGCSITSGDGCDPLPSSPTPEPPSLWLLAAGLLALAAIERRRRRC